MWYGFCGIASKLIIRKVRYKIYFQQNYWSSLCYVHLLLKCRILTWTKFMYKNFDADEIVHKLYLELSGELEL